MFFVGFCFFSTLSIKRDILLESSVKKQKNHLHTHTHITITITYTGAVGSAAGQIAKQFGATTVIGLCGSGDKCDRCLSKYKFDKCLNYKSTTLDDELKALAPFHYFYDNTGGPAASLIKALMVDGGKVAKVGSIGGEWTK